MMGRLSGLSPARARGSGPRELLDRFDLVEAGGRRVATYSGGMRRRLDLAASLVAAPGGDLPRRADHRPRPAQPAGACGRSSRGLVGDGVTVFLTTQYLEEADRLADRIAVMDGGRVVAEGTAGRAQAAGSPDSGWTSHWPTIAASTRSSAPSATARCTATAAQRQVASRPTAAPCTSGRCSTSSTRTRGTVRTLRACTAPTLDDVFLALTGHLATRPRRRPPVSDLPPCLPFPAARAPARLAATGTLTMIGRSVRLSLRNVDALLTVAHAADHADAAVRLPVRRRDRDRHAVRDLRGAGRHPAVRRLRRRRPPRSASART